MPYELLAEPLRGAAAFAHQDNADEEHRAAQSQAAILLLLRSQLAFAREFRQEQAALGASADDAEMVGRERTSELAGDDLEDFPVPWLSEPPVIRFGTAPTDELRRRFGAEVMRGILEGDRETIADVLPEVASNLFQQGTAYSAAIVFEVCLRHPDPRVRVAAGGAYLELSTGEQRRTALNAVVAGTRDPDPEVRDTAATLLADWLPGNPARDELAGEEPPPPNSGPSQTAVLIHGTWAANDPWWQPGGDFNDYLLQTVRPDLYVQRDKFGWSGRYSDQERAMAALGLSHWVSVHEGSDHVDCVITHSHGGNVAMMATWGGLEIDELVLLSCPYHRPRRFHHSDLSSLAASDRRYLPDFPEVSRIEVIRVRLDEVIIADRGHQQFPHDLTQFHANSPVGWFNHHATHDPDVWQQYKIDQWVK